MNKPKVSRSTVRNSIKFIFAHPSHFISEISVPTTSWEASLSDVQPKANHSPWRPFTVSVLLNISPLEHNQMLTDEEPDRSKSDYVTHSDDLARSRTDFQSGTFVRDPLDSMTKDAADAPILALSVTEYFR
jgi:hypothetical protein